MSKYLHIAIAILLCLAIGYLNFSLIRFWFFGEFNANMGSIEISYIQMAKFWAFGGSLWRQWWYLGHPWQIFYTPLLPFLEVVLHGIFDMSFAHAYRIITGIGYILAPVSTFLFVWQISKSKTGALVAAIFYSLLPSVIALIFPEVAQDNLSGGLEPRRFALLVRWGEGPHTLALVFVPLFGTFFSRYLQKGTFLNLFLASLFLVLGILTNAIVVWVCVLLILSFLLSTGAEKYILLDVLKKVGAVALLSFGLCAFWYNWFFVTTFFAEGGGSLNNWFSIFPWGFLVLCGVVFVIYKIAKKLLGGFLGLVMPLFWFLMFFAIVYVYYASGENQLEYAPQALRLTTEVDLSLAVFLGVLVSNVYLFLEKRFGAFFGVGNVLGLFMVAFVAFLPLYSGRNLLSKLPPHTRDISYFPVSNVKNTAEYKNAKKLEELVGDSAERVVAPGNYGFWLNYFVDVPQLRGALFQASAHHWPDHIYYQLANGQDAQISLAWLKIANVGKLVYTTGGSAEIYKDYKVPVEKFDKVLTRIDQVGGDIYFGVPLKDGSPAKIVDYKAISSISKPKNAIDDEPIFAYVFQLEKNSHRKLEVERLGESEMRIKGQIGEGEGVLVQETYNSGWRVKGGSWKISRDPLDFILLVPKKYGQFEVDLVYGRPLSVYFWYLVSIGTFGYAIWRLFGVKFFRKASV